MFERAIGVLPLALLTGSAAGQFTNPTERRACFRDIVTEGGWFTDGGRLALSGDQVVLEVERHHGSSTERGLAIIDVGADPWEHTGTITGLDFGLGAGAATINRIWGGGWDLDGDVLAVAASTFAPQQAIVGIFERSSAGWSLTQVLRFGALGEPLASGALQPRLASGRLAVMVSFDGCSGGWTEGGVATFGRPGPGTPFTLLAHQQLPCLGAELGPHLMALGGDRMAIPRLEPVGSNSSPVDLFAWTGSHWTHTGTADPLLAGAWNGAAHTLALTQGRLVIGTFYDAFAVTFELDALGRPFAPARHSAWRIGQRDFNPPYEASVDLDGDFMVLGVGSHYQGEAPLAAYEHADAAMRPFDLMRSDVAFESVSLDGGRLATLVSRQPPGVSIEYELVLRDLNRARHLPYCRGDWNHSELLMSGSGQAPLDGATFRAYRLPEGALAQVFGALDTTTLPAAALGLCLGSTSVRVAPPVVVDASGSFDLPASGLASSALGPALIPGGTVAFQCAFLAPGATLDTTNALRVRLDP